LNPLLQKTDNSDAMKSFYRRLHTLRPVDALIIAFALLLSAFNLVFSNKVHEWANLILINISVSAGIVLLARAAKVSKSRLIRFIYDWYPGLIVFFSFKEMHVIIQSLARKDYDDLLIAIDRWLFGVNPTAWLAQFSSPLLTEILQIAYASFYLIMLMLGAELYARKDGEKFSYTLFTLVYGFFLSYIGYLIVPGVGPRFTLHDFNALNIDLPGLYVTDALRDFINAGESIPKGVANAMQFAQRDVFPSGHTQMTLIVMFLAAKYKLTSRYVLYLFGTLLIAATVYLRYHYVIDLIGGALFMWFTVWTAPKLCAWWEKFDSA
jgi:membrane-associated phospholipid phosphatase